MKKEKVLQATLFIVLGIPGAFIFVFSGIALFAKLFDPRLDSKTNLPSFSALLGLCVVGLIITLIGVGKLKKWLYAIVFLAFPISFWLWALINPQMDGGIITMMMCIGLVVFGSLKAVQHFYDESK